MELKECPFCGGKAEIMFSGSYTNGGYIVAQCTECGVRTKGVYYRGPVIEIPLEDTVGGEKVAKRWNERMARDDNVQRLEEIAGIRLDARR